MSSSALEAYAEGCRQMPAVMQHMNFEKLRPGQDKAVLSIMMGSDSVVILPTSTGKSACFVIPTLCMRWKSIIIYPLKSLIRDQDMSMRRRGLSVGAISSDTSDAHNASVLRDWAAGDLQFMLVSPERFDNEIWADVVRRTPPDLIALDEAHTLDQWGDNFRPKFKRACELIRELNPKVVVALSATLSVEAEAMARDLLGIPKAALIHHYERRANLKLQTAEFERAADAFPFITNKCPGPVVAYCSAVKRVELYTETLQKITNRPVLMYHGQLAPKEKTYNQDKFMASDNAIVVATNAFGMGVDKRDIRHVVHLDIPGSLISLIQEQGRAGRDGQDSWCSVILTAESVRTQRWFIECGNPTEFEVRRFINACEQLQNHKTGFIDKKRADILERAGLSKMLSQAMMAFCIGERLLHSETDLPKIHRIRFKEVMTWDDSERAMRDALQIVGDDTKGDGWLHADINQLSEQLGRTEATCVKRLSSMAQLDKIDYVRPETTRPLRLELPLSSVPEETWRRLNYKAEIAHHRLDEVLEFCRTPDDEKHEFLEARMNR